MSQEKAAEIIDFNTSHGEGLGPNRAGLGGHETAGAFLAASRRSAGLSLEAISDVIKVKTDHLEAIEATRPDLLPAAPYAAGFVKVYARALGLDAEAVAHQFREDIGAAAPAPLVFTNARSEVEDRPSLTEGARMASIFAVIAIGVFVIWMTAYILGGGTDRDAPTAEASAPRASDIPAFTPRTASRVVETSPAETAPVVEPETGSIPRLKPAIVEASLLESVAPGYPEGCVTGAAPLETVTVMFDITADGRADNSQVVSSSNACFEGEALRALSLWRFSPRMVGGAPSAVAGKRATLNFRG